MMTADRWCPKHKVILREARGGLLRCDKGRGGGHTLTSWLVVSADGQVVAAGRIEFGDLGDPATPAVWLGPQMDDPRFILHTLARHMDTDPTHERELIQVPRGDQE